MSSKPRTVGSISLQTARIVALFGRANVTELSEGLAWYETANTFAQGLAEKHGYTVRQTSGVIAALSPQLSWSMNQRIAEAMCAGNLNPGTALGKNVAKARRILRGEDPSSVLTSPTSPNTGQKVRAFFACIVDPQTFNAVCVDRHAVDLAEGMLHNDNDARGALLRKRGAYEAYAEAYRTAARVLGLQPHKVQAVSWVVWRNLKRAINAPGLEVYTQTSPNASADHVPAQDGSEAYEPIDVFG